MWLHLNTEVPCEFLALNHTGAERKRKKEEEQRKRLEPLAFPGSYVFFSASTIPTRRKHKHGPTICQLCVCLSRESRRVSQSDRKNRRGGTKEKIETEEDGRRNSARSVLAKGRGGRHLYARSNFGTLAFSD